MAIEVPQEQAAPGAMPDNQSPAAGSRPRWLGACRAFVALTKPRIVELLLITTVPAMFLADHRVPPLGLMAATVGGGALTAGGANALNMVRDRDIDAKMSRTRHRPLVTGAVSPLVAALFAVGLEAAGFALLWGLANLLAAALALGAAAFYVLIYTGLLKRSTSQNIVIGGAAGAVPVLVAWAAVTGRLGPAAWMLFAVICLWTPPHFWSLAARYRDDYREAGVPMLPALARSGVVANWVLGYTAATVAVSLAAAPIAGLGVLYSGAAALLGAIFLARAWQFRREPLPGRAMALFRYSITYLTLLFTCVAVDAVLRW